MSENRCTETWCSTCITLLDKCFIPYSNVFSQAPVLVLVYHPHYQIATRLQNLKKESNGYNVKSILSFNLLIINLFKAHLQKEKKSVLIKKSVKMFYLNQALSGKHQVGFMFGLVVSVFCQVECNVLAQCPTLQNKKSCPVTYALVQVQLHDVSSS